MHTTNLPPQRLIFMGTPLFAVKALEVLIKSPYEIVGVYTQAPKAKDRGHLVQKTPVHELADQHHLPVFTPHTLKDPDVQAHFSSLESDLAIVAAYGLILPRRILRTPRLGCINIHASLLPRWRGASPIQRAIMAQDPITGVTLMRMDEGMDTGDMLAKAVIPITETTTTESLHDELTEAGAHLLEKHLGDLIDDFLSPVVQPQDGVTYAPKLHKDEGILVFDGLENAFILDAKIRALNPWPGTRFDLVLQTQNHSETISVRVYESKPFHIKEDDNIDQTLPCGSFFKTKEYPLCVMCANQTGLALLSLQRPSGKRMPSKDFLLGCHGILIHTPSK